MAKRVFCHPVSGSVLLWGGKSDAMSPSNKTTHIVNVAHKYGVTIRAKHQKAHIQYSSYPMVDDELLHLKPRERTAMCEMCECAVADVQAAMLVPCSQVLVNCYAGRNRSGVVVLSYLLQESSWNLGFDSTVSFMRGKTSNALSNRALILACTQSVVERTGGCGARPRRIRRIKDDATETILENARQWALARERDAELTAVGL